MAASLRQALPNTLKENRCLSLHSWGQHHFVTSICNAALHPLIPLLHLTAQLCIPMRNQKPHKSGVRVVGWCAIFFQFIFIWGSTVVQWWISGWRLHILHVSHEFSPGSPASSHSTKTFTLEWLVIIFTIDVNVSVLLIFGPVMDQQPVQGQPCPHHKFQPIMTLHGKVVWEREQVGARVSARWRERVQTYRRENIQKT